MIAAELWGHNVWLVLLVAFVLEVIAIAVGKRL